MGTSGALLTAHQLLGLLYRCTLIDPRPQKLSKVQRKWLDQHQQTPQSQQQCTSANAALHALENGELLQSAPHAETQTVAELHSSAGDVPTIWSEEGPKQRLRCPVSQPKAPVVSSNAHVSTDGVTDAVPLLDREKAKPLQPSNDAQSSTAEALQTCSISDANTSCSLEEPEVTKRNESDAGGTPFLVSSLPSAAAGSRANVQFQKPNGSLPAAHNRHGADAVMHSTHGIQTVHPSTWWAQQPSPSKQSTDHLDMKLLPAAAGLQGQLSHQIQVGKPSMLLGVSHA